jgi:hypothetical protein
MRARYKQASRKLDQLDEQFVKLENRLDDMEEKMRQRLLDQHRQRHAHRAGWLERLRAWWDFHFHH